MGDWGGSLWPKAGKARSQLIINSEGESYQSGILNHANRPHAQTSKVR